MGKLSQYEKQVGTRGRVLGFYTKKKKKKTAKWQSSARGL